MVTTFAGLVIGALQSKQNEENFTRKLTGFSKAVADLFLLHDGNPEWVSEPKVRGAWHWLFLSIVSFGFLLDNRVTPFFAAVFPRIYDTSETFALTDRSVWAA